MLPKQVLKGIPLFLLMIKEKYTSFVSDPTTIALKKEEKRRKMGICASKLPALALNPEPRLSPPAPVCIYRPSSQFLFTGPQPSIRRIKGICIFNLPLISSVLIATEMSSFFTFPRNSYRKKWKYYKTNRLSLIFMGFIIFRNIIYF